MWAPQEKAHYSHCFHIIVSIYVRNISIFLSKLDLIEAAHSQHLAHEYVLCYFYPVSVEGEELLNDIFCIEMKITVMTN